MQGKAWADNWISWIRQDTHESESTYVTVLRLRCVFDIFQLLYTAGSTGRKLIEHC